MGITAGSREVPGRNACDRRHTYRVIIIIIIKDEKMRKIKPASTFGMVMIHHTGTKIPQNVNEKGKDKQQHS